MVQGYNYNTSMLIVVLPFSKSAMSSDEQNNTSKYRVEYVTPEHSKLRLSGTSQEKPNQAASLVATIKVSQEEYVPSGVEVRARISPLIFTAVIPYEVLEQLQEDPAIVVIEPAYRLHLQ
jgi:hypothetical protein